MTRLKTSILFLVLVACALFWLSRKRQQTNWVLPDGSALSLVKVTTGPVHVLPYGKSWLNPLYPIIPAALRNKLHFKMASFTSGSTNDLVIWFQRTIPRQQATGLPVRLAMFDPDGSEISLPEMSQTISIKAVDREITGWTVHSFPHRSAIIGVRLYSPDGLLLGQFTVPNRNAIRYPEWKPESLPASRSSDPLEVTLLGFETGVAMPGLVVTGSGRTGARATFALKTMGVVSHDWCVTHLIATSATGERHISNPGYWLGDVQVVDFDVPLWVQEPAWKLRAEVARAANYPERELWTWTGMVVPGPKQFAQSGAITNLYMSELEFLGISSPGAVLPTRCVAVTGWWNAHLRTPYPLNDWKVSLVEVRDQVGGTALLQGQCSATSDGGRGITPREMIYGFGFDLPSNAQTLDLTFAITPIHFFDFQAKPVLARAGKVARNAHLR